MGLAYPKGKEDLFGEGKTHLVEFLLSGNVPVCHFEIRGGGSGLRVSLLEGTVRHTAR